MSDSTPATECTIPQPGPSAPNTIRRADESLSLLIAGLKMRFEVPPADEDAADAEQCVV
jgi:hypothetical protein